MANEESQKTAQEKRQTRVGHCKADGTDVYVGRGPGGLDMFSTAIGQRGWLGNPHSVDDHGREGSIVLFRVAFEHRLELDGEFRAAVRQLAGQTLGCWCQRLDDDAPACHAEVITEHADRLYWKREAEQSDRYEWCEECGMSYFAHFDGCPHNQPAGERGH